MTPALGIHHVSLLVSDTRRALAFYHGILGLPLDPGRPDLGFPGAWLSIGAQQLHLLELGPAADATGNEVHGGRDRHFAMRVMDLGAVRAALEAHGIGYTLSRSGRQALFCRDPDGNAVEIIEQPGG